MGTMKRYDQYLHDWVPVDQLTVFIEGGSPPVEDWYIPNPDWEDIMACPPNTVQALFSDAKTCECKIYSTVSSGVFTVDWGDGTIESFSNGVTGYHKYIKGSGKPCDLDYTTFKISITGNVLDLRFNPPGQEYPLTMDPNWGALIGIVINHPTINFLNMLINSNGSSYDMLEFFKIISAPAATTMNLTFKAAQFLKMVDISSDNAIWSATEAFYQCRDLKYVKLNLPKLTTAASLFYACWAINIVDISSFILCTNFSNMFFQSSLRKVILPNSTVSKNCTGMLNACKVEEVDLLGFSNINNASFFMQDNYYLKTVNLRDSLINSTTLQSVVHGCINLVKFLFSPVFSEATTMQSFMQNCQNIRHDILIGDIPKVTFLSSAFYGCHSLPNITISGGRLVSDIGSVCNECYALKSFIADLVGLNATSVNGSMAFYKTQKLEYLNLPSAKLSAINVSSATSATYISKFRNVTFNAASLFLGSSPQVFIQYDSMTADDLNDLFTRLPVVTGKTVNMTGTLGAATCNRTIATAKGWTVTG